jgi:hypothetical protein
MAVTVPFYLRNSVGACEIELMVKDLCTLQSGFQLDTQTSYYSRPMMNV